MKTSAVRLEDLRGVFAVPPLCRRETALRPLDFQENDRLVRHVRAGGLSRLLYGGNAFLYHLTLAEYEELLDWLDGLPDDLWAVPGLGPSYGRAMDQARLLRRHSFPCAMALPCADPRDARGLEAGLREVSQAAGMPLVLYLKDESNLGSDREAGLDAVARLVDDGVAVAVKYAVVGPDPIADVYLEGLLRRVDRRRVVSGMGERPAVAHLRALGLPGFTTGSGCLAPRLANAVFEACARSDFGAAEAMRAFFLPLEDERDAWGPARVLHAAVDVSALARTGPIPPFVSPLPEERRVALSPLVQRLLVSEKEHGVESAARTAP
jgi:4-hydroxy-tetrahydrodipicolinate synthase